VGRRLLLGVASAAILVLPLAACSSSSSSSSATTAPATTAGAATTNHTFTADDGSFNIELDPNGGGTQTFATAGTFTYHCEIHPSMKGTVVVQG